MLKIENLSIRFENKIVLDDLTLVLESNKIHGLIGLNGSGKTTFLNCLFGFIKYDSGRITFQNKELNRGDISFLETTNFFYANLTGREFLSIFPQANEKFNVDEWSSLLELPIDEMIDGYSTGMKKKLALLSVLKLDRKIIILDEPFNGLDIETNHLLEKLIPILKQKGKTIIVTSHILGSLDNICDEIHLLKGGKIQRSFSKPEFQSIKDLIFENSTIDNTLQNLV